MVLNVWDCDYFPGKDKKTKHFEKQLKKQYSRPGVSSPIFDVGFKSGWKAAFELIRETHENYSVTEVLRLVDEELQ